MKFGTVTSVLRGIVIVWSLSLVAPASAQELSGTPSKSSPASTLAGTLPDTHSAPLTGEQALRTPQTSEIGGAEVGQRLTTSNLAPNSKPLARINNRIENRVENRVDNRIDRSQDVNQDPTAAYQIATTRVRAATNVIER